MRSTIKKVVLMSLMMVGIVSLPAGAWAESEYHPTNDGGNFGLGLELGEPGSWGATGKIWIDKLNAFQPAVKFTGGSAILQLDYLWHHFNVIHMKNTDGEMPLYIGVGGDLLLEG